MPIPFVKMHGLGNDYIYVDAFTHPEIASRADLPALARAMSDRHRGVGGDGLILVCRPEPAADGSHAHARMRMFNADGSESEMCGNGVRCVAKFAHDRLGLNASPLVIQTGAGPKTIRYTTRDNRLVEATVDMGVPVLDLAKVPVDDSRLGAGSRPHEHTVDVDGRAFRAVFVSMGNPHAVLFDDQLHGKSLSLTGPLIEVAPMFPRRVNVHSVSVLSPTHARMATWERGSGITLACGTGACAVLVAGVLTNRLSREATITLPGGDLRIRWDESTKHVFMTGPAEDVFEGIWPDLAV